MARVMPLPPTGAMECGRLGLALIKRSFSRARAGLEVSSTAKARFPGFTCFLKDAPAQWQPGSPFSGTLDGRMALFI
jgi:hypothetical protein